MPHEVDEIAWPGARNLQLVRFIDIQKIFWGCFQNLKVDLNLETVQSRYDRVQSGLESTYGPRLDRNVTIYEDISQDALMCHRKVYG